MTRDPHLSQPVQAPAGNPSATPIYDALYAEWVKSYRTLPGDRHGEEELVFRAFGTSAHGVGSYASVSSGTYGGRNATAPYATGHLTSQHGTRQEPQRSTTAPAVSVWQPVGRVPTAHPGMHHRPAALPPGPRRGL